MHQVVLDTNVLVAALRSKRGASHRLIQMMGLGVFQTNISVAVVLEYEDVLQRKGLLPGMNRVDMDAFLMEGLHPRSLQRPNPNDECILEVALSFYERLG